MPESREERAAVEAAIRLLQALADGDDVELTAEEIAKAVPPADAEAMVSLARSVQHGMGRGPSVRHAHDVIVELARELTDPDMTADRVLQVIVDRTRSVLPCDYAYLSINDDERSETYLRAASGAVTDAWCNVRIPFGIGLGGRIAATGRPMTSPDYLIDDSLPHAAAVDLACRAEGQRAIMGAPLIHRGRVIGVLYASNRTATQFMPQDQDLLSAFAALAAVGIEHSRLFTELSSMNESLRERSAQVHRAAEAHDSTMEVLLRGGGLEEIIDAAVRMLGGDFVVVGADSACLARSSGTDDELRQALTAMATGSMDVSARVEQVGQFYRCGLAAGEQVLGWLAWRPGDQADRVLETDLQIVERTAVVVSLLLLFRENVIGIQRRLRGELLQDLLNSTNVDIDVSPQRMSRIGYVMDAPQVLVAFQVAPKDRHRLAALLADEAASQGGLSGTHEGVDLLLVPGRDASSAARTARRSVAPLVAGFVTVGASTVITSARDARRAFDEAVGCLRALARLGRSDTSAAVDDLGFVGLLIGTTISADAFIERVLGPVIEHDRSRGTELIRTLEVYVASGQSLAASAQQLHIHVNTVSQRLGRCRDLLGATWNDSEAFLEIQVALRLRAVARSSIQS